MLTTFSAETPETSIEQTVTSGWRQASLALLTSNERKPPSMTSPPRANTPAFTPARYPFALKTSED